MILFFELMMNFLQKIKPEWTLRLSLGLMYLYSGYDLFYYPQHWYGFVPKWLSQAVTPIISVEAYLRLQGAGEFVIGLLFLAPLEQVLMGRAWFSGKLGVRIAAIAATLEMALILLFVGVDPITFRDIGLLGAAAAILILSLDILHSNFRNEI